MWMHIFPESAIGAIVAALIAGVISLLGLIISKEQKVSDFRQAWIDSLRSELSALVAHSNAIYGMRAAHLASAAEAWKETRADFVGVNEAAARIRLRLNPSEPAAKAVLEEIEVLETLLAPGSAVNHTEIDSAERELVARSQVVLKAEWLRVRGGERVYRLAKAASAVICLLAVVALAGIGIRALVNQHPPTMPAPVNAPTSR
jgi:hypothetical protein